MNGSISYFTVELMLGWNTVPCNMSCTFISSWAWTDDERHTAIWITLLCLHRWSSSICCIQLKILLPSEVVIMSESHSSDYFWMLAMCYKLSISFLARKMCNIQRMLQTGHKTDNMANDFRKCIGHENMCITLLEKLILFI